MAQHQDAVRPGYVWAFGVLSFAVFTVFAFGLAQHWQSDFEVYRAGGSRFLGSDLYIPHITATGKHLLFTYTPIAALVFWPFSLLSSWAGQLIWDLANVVALTALIAVSAAAARKKTPQRGEWQLALIAVAPVGLLLSPIRYGFELGQINVVLILMIVTDLTMAVSWRSTRIPRGALLGVAAAIKLTPLIFIPYLCITRQWAAARNAAVTFVVATGLMFLAAPRSSWNYFTKYAFDVQRVGSMTITTNQTLRAAVERSEIPVPHFAVDLLLAVLVCTGLAVATIAYRRSSALLGILVCAATGLLLSPISWQHHYAWCVPLLAWLSCGVDRPKWRIAWSALAVVVFVVPLRAQATSSNVAEYVRGNSYVIATVVFIGLIATLLWMRRRDVLPRPRSLSHRRQLKGPHLSGPDPELERRHEPQPAHSVACESQARAGRSGAVKAGAAARRGSLDGPG